MHLSEALHTYGDPLDLERVFLRIHLFSNLKAFLKQNEFMRQLNFVGMFKKYSEYFNIQIRLCLFAWK